MINGDNDFDKSKVHLTKSQGFNSIVQAPSQAPPRPPMLPLKTSPSLGELLPVNLYQQMALLHPNCQGTNRKNPQ
jgi:hypothetical protein